MKIEQALRELRADKSHLTPMAFDDAKPRPKHNDLQTGLYNWQDHTCEID